MARSPRRRIRLVTVTAGLMAETIRLDRVCHRQFDTSHGCQDHTPLPSAASSAKTLRPAHVLPTEIPAKAFKRRSSSRRLLAHRRTCPATPPRADAAASTASHPAFVTIAIPLSWARDGGSCRGDLGQSESELFSHKRIDRLLGDLGVGQNSAGDFFEQVQVTGILRILGATAVGNYLIPTDTIWGALRCA